MLAYQPLATLCHQVNLPDKNYVMLHCKQRDAFERAQYVSDVSVYSTVMFILLMKLELIAEIYYINMDIESHLRIIHFELGEKDRLLLLVCQPKEF